MPKCESCFNEASDLIEVTRKSGLKQKICHKCYKEEKLIEKGGGNWKKATRPLLGQPFNIKKK